MSNEKKNRKNVPMVLITVSGGVADLICKPAGVAVRIYDYDVDGCEEAGLDKDPDDQSCMIRKFPTGQAVIANKHWPVVKHAIRNISQTNFRRWKCTGCGRTIEHSYEALADVGIPICGDCDIDMEMVS